MRQQTVAASLAVLFLLVASGAAFAVQIGVMGSSISDEYFEAPYNYATNWTMQLVNHRGVDMGPIGAWGEPRRNGYEYNWARSGDDTSQVLSHGQHTGLAAQVGPEGIDYAVYLMPSNDQIAVNPEPYQSIYLGLYSPAQITTWVNSIVTNVDTALATVAATGVKMVLVNPGDYGYTQAVQSVATDPVGRQRMADALVELSGELEDLAAEYEMPFVDLNASQKAIFGPHASLNTTLAVGNVDIFLQAWDTPTGTNPTAALVHDKAHPNTVLQAMTANLVMEALNIGYDAGFELFSEQDILGFAGIAYGGSDTVVGQIGPYSDYIVNYVPEPSSLALATLAIAALAFVTLRRRKA